MANLTVLTVAPSLSDLKPIHISYGLACMSNRSADRFLKASDPDEWIYNRLLLRTGPLKILAMARWS